MARRAIFGTIDPVRLDRLSSWPRAGFLSAFLSLGAIAACSGGRGAGDQPRGPDPVVATGPTVAASSTATMVEPPAPVVEVAPVETEPAGPVEPAGAELRRRYQVTTARQTLTDDRGDGRADLYGTRNVRAVLNGVFFRGGANNAFHRDGKRANKNPLPSDGLTNLCQQGFTTAVYLYPTNFETAPKELTCQTVDGDDGTIDYAQITSQHYKKADLRFLFGLILDAVHDPAEHGAVYAHCWNGWHASGYVAAITLRQFCGFTGPQALRYWSSTAKGASNTDHDDTKDRINKFKPFPELSISAEDKARLCPDPKTFKFRPEP